MADAPEKIWLRWEPGKAITQGPLTKHPDYTGYTRPRTDEGHGRCLTRCRERT